MLELFVRDTPTARAWVNRAALQQELYFEEASAQHGVPLARFGVYPAEDIDNFVATDFQTAKGSPRLSVSYFLLCSA